MILFIGKAKDLTYEAIVRAYLLATRPVESLESAGFPLN